MFRGKWAETSLAGAYESLINGSGCERRRARHDERIRERRCDYDRDQDCYIQTDTACASAAHASSTQLVYPVDNLNVIRASTSTSTQGPTPPPYPNRRVMTACPLHIPFFNSRPHAISMILGMIPFHIHVKNERRRRTTSRREGNASQRTGAIRYSRRKSATWSSRARRGSAPGENVPV
jgi:hypothetical protein